MSTRPRSAATPSRTTRAATQAATPPRSRRPAPAMALDGALSLRQGMQSLGGADRVALLEAIRDSGSMTRAATAVGISYKTAWDRVQDMNNVSAQPLVARSAGGAGGGGTTLTPYAEQLIAAFRQLEHEHTRMLYRLSKTLAGPHEALHTLAALGLRTSARNQLAGTVTAVQAGAVNAMVELALPGGVDHVRATLTMRSLAELGIAVGTLAVALIKAPSVFVVVVGEVLPDKALRLSVGNALAGRVSALQVGAVNTEVQVALTGGQTVVAMLSRDSAERLKLAVGAPVQAAFLESSVVLGVV